MPRAVHAPLPLKSAEFLYTAEIHCSLDVLVPLLDRQFYIVDRAKELDHGNITCLGEIIEA